MMSNGDYLIVMSDDLILNQGSLKELCDEKFVTSPLINYQQQDFWGCCFCIPRWVYEKVGGLSEDYRISYFDDDDYVNELRKASVSMKAVTSVNFDHSEGGRTLHKLPDWQVFYAENRQRFIDKWGGVPQQITAFWEKHGRLPKKEELK